jgi:hypothetical protein
MPAYQRDWFTTGDDDGGVTPSDTDQAFRDAYRWTGTITRLVLQEDAWLRIELASGSRIRFKTEAYFARGLMRWTRGRAKEARTDFETAKGFGAVSVDEYYMAMDALAVLGNL